MLSNIFKFLFIVFVFILGALLFREDFRSYLSEELFRRGVFTKMRELEIPIDDIKTEIKKVSENLPKPLISKTDSFSEDILLNVDKIIIETNLNRTQNGKTSLSSNMQLKLAAEKKVDDMFKLQYFDHNSPQGLSPSDFVEKAGYSFLTVGENLALGMFKDEKDLVQAWMDSPGHRANILSDKFVEIGVSAKKGLYKGEMVWMAVQEFGKPSSVCPAPSESEKQMIESYIKSVKEFAINLEVLRNEIEKTPKNNPKYNQMVNNYNDLVREYNLIVKDLELKTKIYNQKATDFNECVEENT